MATILKPDVNFKNQYIGKVGCIINQVDSRGSEKLFQTLDMQKEYEYLKALKYTQGISSTFKIEKTNKALRELFRRPVVTKFTNRVNIKAPFTVITLQDDGNLVMDYSGRCEIFGSKTDNDKGNGVLYVLLDRRKFNKIIADMCLIRDNRELWVIDALTGRLSIFYKTNKVYRNYWPTR